MALGQPRTRRGSYSLALLCVFPVIHDARFALIFVAGVSTTFRFSLRYMPERLMLTDSFQDPGLISVARGCPKLEKLMLTGCGDITGKSVRALARGCSTLKDLSLSGCGGVGNGDLKELARGCTNLRHLNIAECAQVDNEWTTGTLARPIVLV